MDKNNKDKPVPKEWFDWFLSPPEDWRKKYGDAFKWTTQEKMLMQQLNEKNTHTHTRRRTHD